MPVLAVSASVPTVPAARKNETSQSYTLNAQTWTPTAAYASESALAPAPELKYNTLQNSR